MFRIVFAVSGLHTCCWHPARLQSWSRPGRSLGRPTVRHNVTGYDGGPALPEEYEPLLGQDSQGVLQRRDPDVL